MTKRIDRNVMHTRWPPDRFYWGVLDISPLERSHRRSAQRLSFLFEPLLPIPLDSVHAVFVRVDNDRVLACAATFELLEEGVDPEVLTLTPTALPAHLVELSVDPSRLNLLIGRYTPRPIRRERQQLVHRAIGAIIVLLVLVSAGLYRRALHLEQAHTAIAMRTDAVYTDILGPSAHTRAQPPSLQLTAELRRLQRTRQATALPVVDSFDLARELEQLFSRWPNDTHLVTDLIALSPEALTIRASLPSEETQQALTAIQAWNDWQRVQPEIINQRGRSNLTLRFTRERGLTTREVAR